MSTDSQNNKRIVRNTAFLYIRMFFVLVVSLYTSRVVLNTLGVTDFGVYNVVAGFVSLFGFLNTTLSSSMQRFYNFEGTRDKENGFRKVYFTGLAIHIIIGFVLLVVLETVGLWYINNVMVVPADRLLAANIVYQISIFSMILVIIQIPYVGAIMADERMDFYAIVSIVDVVLKLLAVLALPYFNKDKLVTYGVLLGFITLFDMVAYFVYAKRTILNFSLKYTFDKRIFNSLISFSGWNLLGTFAFLLKGQGVNMVLNFFSGPIVNAARGIAFQVNNAVSSFSGNIATAFRPQVVNYYANGNIEHTRNLMYLESKVCYSLSLIIIVPLIIELPYVLNLWLGDVVPQHTSIFTALALVDMLICTLNTPLTQVAHSTGNIKIYQIACSCVNIMLVPMCWLLMKLGFGPVSAFSITIVFSIINQIVCLWQLHTLFPYSNLEYIFNVLKPCILMTVLLPILPYITRNSLESSAIRLVLVCIEDVVISMILFYFIILNKSERSFAKQYIKSKNLK